MDKMTRRVINKYLAKLAADVPEGLMPPTGGKADEPISVGRLVDLAGLVLAFDAYISILEEQGADDNPGITTQAITLLRRYGDDLRLAMEQHLTPLAKRPDAASMKTLFRQAIRSGAVTVTVRKQAELFVHLFPWMRSRPAVFNGLFTGRSTRAARELAGAAEESAPAGRLNRLATIAPVSGITIHRKWMENAAKAVGAPIKPAESVLADAQVAKGLGEDLSRVEEQIASARPNTPDVADLQEKRLGLMEKIDLVAERSEDRSTVMSAAVSAATAPPPKSAVASRFGLSDEQAEVMNATGKVVVAAGAGSGKTQSLVATISHLVEEKGYNSGQIMTCSFTRASSAELESRLEKAGISGVAVGTTHHMARSIIERNRPDLALSMRNTKGADKCFKIALVQVTMDAAGYQKQLEANKSYLQRIEGIPGWRSIDILRSFHEQLSKGRNLSEKQLAVLPKFERSRRWGYSQHTETENLEHQWWGTIAPAPQPKKAEVNPEKGDELGGGKRSKFWTMPAGEWFNIGKPLVDEAGGKLSGKRAQLVVENFKNAGVSVEEARKDEGDTPVVALYGAYEWLKKNDPVYGPAMDFTDQLVTALQIVSEDPAALAAEQSQYKCILVDEAQDLNQIQYRLFQLVGDKADVMMYVGDDKQCLGKSSTISTPSGPVHLCDMVGGDPILSYRNGQIVPQQVKHIMPSQWTWGFRVTTESGKTVTMSPNHKLWATEPVLTGDECFVYLMYRRDLGFRVGITRKGSPAKRGENYYESISGRAFMERAERMWVLEVCKDKEAALLAETSYSLTYRVPTCVFNGTNRRVNQDRLNQVFERFGQNGSALLVDRHLSFDLPHWISQGYTKHCRGRHVIQFLAHTTLGTQITLEWEGDSFDKSVQDLPLSSTGRVFSLNGERRRLRRYFASYRDAVSFLDALATRTEAVIVKRLATPDGNLRHLVASALFPGMALPVEDEENGITLDTIVSIERVEDEFLDLEVDDASNFFGGGILSHNSIFGFRGAKPANYVGLTKTPGYQTKLMTLNYRSGSQIVDAANRLIAYNEDRQVPMVCKAHEAKGPGAIRAKTPGTHEEGAVLVAQEIKDAIDAGESASHFGILVRNNAETDAFMLALISRGIPYRTLRKEQGGYFGKPVVRALTAWIRLIIGGSPAEINDAVIEAHHTPGFGLDQQFEANLGRMSRGGTYLDYIQAGGEVYTGQAAWLNRRVKEYADAIRTVRSEGRGESGMLIRSIFKLKGPKGTFVDALMRMVDEDDVLEDEGVEGGEDALRMAALAPVRPLMQMAENFPDPANLMHFIGKMKAANEKAQKRTPESKEDFKEAAVLLGTVHGWKGLQAKHVYVCMAGGVFPNFRSDEKARQQETEHQPVTAYDEERRLAYVGITRGEQSSTVICPRVNYLGKQSSVSRFASEACIPFVGEPEQAKEEEQAVQAKTAGLIQDSIEQLREMSNE